MLVPRTANIHHRCHDIFEYPNTTSQDSSLTHTTNNSEQFKMRKNLKKRFENVGKLGNIFVGNINPREASPQVPPYMEDSYSTVY